MKRVIIDDTARSLYYIVISRVSHGCIWLYMGGGIKRVCAGKLISLPERDIKYDSLACLASISTILSKNFQLNSLKNS